jgi:hypothetical protein
MQVGNCSGLVDREELITWDKPVSTSFGSETKALKSLTNPALDVLVREIVEDLEAALEQFREIAAGLSGDRLSES